MDLVPEEKYNMRTKDLYKPPLRELCNLLNKDLKCNYKNVHTEIIDNLEEVKDDYIYLDGLSGRSILIDVGGETFNHNKDYQHVGFNLGKIKNKLNFKECYCCGSGAAHAASIGTPGEIVINTNFDYDDTSIYASVKNNKCFSDNYFCEKCGGLGNYFYTEALKGDFIKIVVKERIGEENSFPKVLKKTLNKYDKPIGMFGFFKILNGKVKAHIQPPFEECPQDYFDIEKQQCCKPFLKFFDGEDAMGPDLMCVTTLWNSKTDDGTLGLRESGEHTHFFGIAEDEDDRRVNSGHYHGDIDLTKDTIEYIAYLNVSDQICKIRNSYVEKNKNDYLSKKQDRKLSVAIVGSGAMGCLFGHKLKSANIDVLLIDKWKQHIKNIQDNGLKILYDKNEKHMKIDAIDDIEKVNKKYDIIIIQCKSNNTLEAIKSAKHLFHKNSIALSFQNGLGNEETISEVLGEGSKVLGGQTLEGASIEGPGVVRVHTDLESYIGAFNDNTNFDEVSIIAELFSDAGLTTYPCKDINKRKWMKCVYNCVVSPFSALTTLSHKDIYGKPDAEELANMIIQETIKVALEHGINITLEEGKELLEKVIASNQDNKSSMCVDILNKRKSEIEFINGYIVRLGKKYNVDVSFNRLLYFLIKQLEFSNTL